MQIFGAIRVDPSGAQIAGYNVKSFTKSSTGLYTVVFSAGPPYPTYPAPTPVDALIQFSLNSTLGGKYYSIVTDDDGTGALRCVVSIFSNTTSTTPVDAPFSITALTTGY